MIQRAKELGDIHRARIAISSPVISHLLFVDNSLFFGRANEEESRWLEILKRYGQEASLLVNYNKSVFFSGDMDNTSQQAIRI